MLPAQGNFGPLLDSWVRGLRRSAVQSKKQLARQTALGVVALLDVGACANPKETVVNNPATRASDRAAGTNVAGAYPQQSDGTPVKPPGTTASRTMDRAVGTDMSGAYPQNLQRR